MDLDLEDSDLVLPQGRVFSFRPLGVGLHPFPVARPGAPAPIGGLHVGATAAPRLRHHLPPAL